MGAPRRIRPSGLKQVLECPASVWLSEGVPAHTTDYAEEGTLAHALMEKCLDTGTDSWEHLDMSHTTSSGEVLTVDEDMIGHIQPCIERVRRVVRATAGTLDLEVHCALPGTEIHGTADVLCTTVSFVYVGDLKYGAGIPVPADTVQLGCYGLMAYLSAFGQESLDSGPLEDVLAYTEVFQPRVMGSDTRKCILKPVEVDQAAGIRAWTWTRGDLQDLQAKIMDIIEEVAAKSTRFGFGEHCRFCDVTAVCPKLKAVAKDAAMSHLLGNPDLVASAESLAAALSTLPVLKMYARAVSDLAYRYADEGGEIEGWALVNTLSNRTWEDPEKAKARMIALGIDPMAEAQLISPAAATKALSPDKKGSLDDYITRVVTGAKIAPTKKNQSEVDRDAARDAYRKAADTAKNIIKDSNT